MPQRVADLIVRGLEAHGLNRFYCVPGESYLAVLDALHDSNSIETVVCRHESGAGFMAVAEAKMTGKPAVFAVSRGPGATNGSIAIHVAQQDALPVIVLIGQVSREERGRGAFQEVDYDKFYGSMCKAVYEVADADKMSEVLARAFHVAQEGVPGPVAISLPEDVLTETTESPVPQPYPVHRPSASDEDCDRLLHYLAKAERPVLMAGAVMRSVEGKAALKAFSERHQVPVATTWKNQDVFDNTSPLYAGHTGFGTPAAHKEMLQKADLIIAVGTRLGDVASLNYSFPRAPKPTQPLVHIYPDSRPIGAVFETELGLVADPARLLSLAAAEESTVNAARTAWVKSLGQFIDTFTAFQSPNPADGVDYGEVVVAISRQAPKDAIILTDAGNISTWVHRHWRMTTDNLLIGGIAGAMGNGVPGSVAVNLVAPDRMPICFVGDGGILMTGNELATAVLMGAKPKIVLSDNGIYGTIRTHQEREYPGRVSGTTFANPDFTQWAASFGIHTVTIKRGDDVEAKVGEALGHDGATVIHVHSSPTAISAFGTIKPRGNAA